MKDDINILGDIFKQEISTIKSEEDSLRKMEAEYKKALSTLQSNNEKRIKSINEIRINKIQEINDELEKNNLELKELKSKLNSMLLAYCDKNGHTDVLISRRTLGLTGIHSFAYGSQYFLEETYRCVVCGRTRSYKGKGYNYYSEQKDKQEFIDDIYDDGSLTEDGKTFQMIQEEIQKIIQYINYLDSLKSKLCELFGHDAKMIDTVSEKFKCNCCGNVMSYKVYIDSHHKAKYRGIVDFYYGTLPDNDYLISSNGKLELSLPPFTSYQKTLTRKRKNNQD